MINSLLKDSHITHNKRSYESYPLESNVSGKMKRRELSCNASVLKTVNKDNIIMRRPAEIAFSGFSHADLANAKEFGEFFNGARAFLTEKGLLNSTKNKNYEKVVKFISDSLEHFNGKNEVDDAVKEFIGNDKNKSTLNSVIDNAKKIIKEYDKRKKLSEKEIADMVPSTVTKAAEGFDGVENPTKLMQNKGIKKFLLMAAEKQAVFNAFFAIGLTCILRPAAIMALPTDKKNADDKKYAAAHSIASGVIGYGLACILFNPISKAVKKVTKHPNYFFKDKAQYLKDPKLMRTAGTWLNMLPDTLVAAPRAVITVALIPPILKYVFGWEKKSDLAKKVPVSNTQVPSAKQPKAEAPKTVKTGGAK